MNLKDTISLYQQLAQKRNFEEIEQHEYDLITEESIEFSEIIEKPYPRNFQLEILMSADKHVSLTEFLYHVMYQLEYEPIEEFPFFKVEEYPFSKMIKELWMVEARDFLDTHIPSESRPAVIKLKNKEELTFLIETESNYIYLSEIYWKS